MTHRMHCQDPWFTLIKQGKKPVEGRKNSPKYRSWKPGDKIIFFLADDEFETIITAINHYASIEDYLKGETLERALPGVQTIEEGIRIYSQWSTQEEIQRFGFLGIQVALVSPK